MGNKKNDTEKRKKDHIDLCLNEDVGFSRATNGFENYEFEHNAITEIEFEKIDLSTKFFGYKIAYPFLISCMTGGTSEAEKINEQLAIAANKLKIPVGVGSQRQSLEDKKHHSTYDVIKKNALDVPILANIGAAQIAQIKDVKKYEKLIELVDAKVFVIHVNPLQELLQKNGEPNFKGLLNRIEKLVSRIEIPIMVKEVGSGISKNAARRLLDTGVKGIDVAGAGGTSWAEVELKRNDQVDEYFRNWGLPTSFSVRKVAELKRNYNFELISSGGIQSGIEIAKSIVLGADMAASARPLLKTVMNGGVESIVKILESWFLDLRKIMYLTGTQNIKQLKKIKLIRKSELY